MKWVSEGEDANRRTHEKREKIKVRGKKRKEKNKINIDSLYYTINADDDDDYDDKDCVIWKRKYEIKNLCLCLAFCAYTAGKTIHATTH